MLEKIKEVVPGTQQVQIVPLVTMVMVLVTFVVTEYTGLELPEIVWGAITGLAIYGLQYWHGPR